MTRSTPPDPGSGPITQALHALGGGDRSALDAVFAGLYGPLKLLARSRLRQQGRADQLGTTTVVHESFMRLVRASELRLEDRHHFFAYAARVMRHVIIDAAREQLTERRGGEMAPARLDPDAFDQLPASEPSAELVLVSEALLRLEKVSPELAELVDMRYFGGYTEEEIASLLGTSDRTIRRRWEKARVWLMAHMDDDARA
jgi:RNA polymerase sigma factor (TIGR02999 family)